jgi:hypothetical protein
MIYNRSESNRFMGRPRNVAGLYTALASLLVNVIAKMSESTALLEARKI